MTSSDLSEVAEDAEMRESVMGLTVVATCLRSSLMACLFALLSQKSKKFTFFPTPLFT